MLIDPFPMSTTVKVIITTNPKSLKRKEPAPVPLPSSTPEKKSKDTTSEMKMSVEKKSEEKKKISKLKKSEEKKSVEMTITEMKMLKSILQEAHSAYMNSSFDEFGLKNTKKNVQFIQKIHAFRNHIGAEEYDYSKDELVVSGEEMSSYFVNLFQTAIEK